MVLINLALGPPSPFPFGPQTNSSPRTLCFPGSRGCVFTRCPGHGHSTAGGTGDTGTGPRVLWCRCLRVAVALGAVGSLGHSQGRALFLMFSFPEGIEGRP